MKPARLLLKFSKGAVTRNGLPEDEMNACVTAGNHDGLVQLIGQIANHPENKNGTGNETDTLKFLQPGPAAQPGRNFIFPTTCFILEKPVTPAIFLIF
ncbi:hypothetical protein SNE26_21765 [Mucilaginibacter sp. cycad4]|uniref:hypothetical protein n=1 Tax=Mucilaginibacter sp. cycad4 TaxID=3342096 RepID=UPI002AABB565|nr:hypothetical protein [Mucilaginibacter gossypii]WPU98649.1 hypothetical protein SNE26_21765 [Mucilaginibacter gossypii]